MALAVPLLIVSLLVILFAAELFTNGVEWLGRGLSLNEGAVGSILAAVGTAMPETMIPLIAILFTGTEASDEIGVGAILGAPFMLSTAAFAVTGLAILILVRRGRRTADMAVDTEVLSRDMGYFLVVYVVAISVTVFPAGVKIATAIVLLGLYLLYAYRTLTAEGALAETELDAIEDPFHLARLLRLPANRPPLALSALQFLLALGIIIVAAKVFVSNMETVAEGIGVPALILALILAPLATELPEKFNSVIWVREGKDTLAMGNISGAMVFQSCVPVAVGLIFTPWELTQPALVSGGIAIASTAIVFASLRRDGFLRAPTLARAGLLYLAFVGYVIVHQAL